MICIPSFILHIAPFARALLSSFSRSPQFFMHHRMKKNGIKCVRVGSHGTKCVEGTYHQSVSCAQQKNENKIWVPFVRSCIAFFVCLFTHFFEPTSQQECTAQKTRLHKKYTTKTIKTQGHKQQEKKRGLKNKYGLFFYFDGGETRPLVYLLTLLFCRLKRHRTSWCHKKTKLVNRRKTTTQSQKCVFASY